VNSGSGYVRGAEIASAYRLTSQWSLLANFTDTRGQDTFNKTPLRFIPPANGLAAILWEDRTHRFRAEANETMMDRLRRPAPGDLLDAGFSVDPGYGSPSATNPAYRPGFQIPGYEVANLRFGVKLLDEGKNIVDLTTDLNNVLNQRYREPYSQQQILAPGFGAVVGLRWRF
jgi:outer membrane receptor protein involved in Fe transport